MSRLTGVLLVINFPRLQKIKRMTSQVDTSNELPAELDFFKYARTGTGKRKQKSLLPEQSLEKRRRVDGEDEAAKNIIEDDAKELTDIERPQERHKVTSKGSHIPEPVDTFESLYKEYNVPPHVYQNLSKSGYNYPTSIQSHAVPVLLKVRFSSDHHLSFVD